MVALLGIPSVLTSPSVLVMVNWCLSSCCSSGSGLSAPSGRPPHALSVVVARGHGDAAGSEPPMWHKAVPQAALREALF